MKKHIILFTAGLLLGINSITAQVRELKIGDDIPRDVVSEIINYPTSTINIADHDDKLIILDYWGLSCSPCIAAFPKYEKLQKTFGDSILLLPVVTTGKITTEGFWSKNIITRNVNLPSIVGDNILGKYFPHLGVPFEVWIKNGKVFALTGSEYVNEKEIRAILKGETRNWEIYNKIKYNYDSSLIPTNSHDNSYFGNYIPRVRPRILLKEGTATTEFSTIRIINLPIIELYWEALKKKADFRDYKNRMYVEIKDPTRLNKPKDEYTAEWNSHNSYCYESNLPGKVSDSDHLEKMKKDLDHHFNLNGRIEKKKLKCWVLIKDNNHKEQNSSKGAGQLLKLEATSLQDLSDKLNNIVDGPFVTTDEKTSIDFPQPVTMQIPGKGSIDDYRAALRKAGFDIKLEDRDINSFVITER